MPEVRVILIAAPELIPTLRERVGDDEQVWTFSDSEPLRALEAISSQRPPIVALERLFAASPRGAALISRIKADPALDQSEIRVLSHDSDYQRVSPRIRDLPPPKVAVRRPALDPGTRRAPRFPMQEDAPAGLDGQEARLVDLSLLGAQVIATVEVRAKQRVTITLGEADSAITMAGTIAWARLELSRKGPTYRVGIEFIDPDTAAVGAFCEANRIR
jgi:hypothetical protein